MRKEKAGDSAPPRGTRHTMKGSYNATLVAFSVLIAILTSYTALALAARVNAVHGRFR